MMQGYIVLITRNGSLGKRYPITSNKCTFGQSPVCDVRLYVSNVARKHCEITSLPDGQAHIYNLSPQYTTLVNGNSIGGNSHTLRHADVITVGDRHFRWEYPMNRQTPMKAMLPMRTPESNNKKNEACMVQLPLSVLKKKRHSMAGVVRENKTMNISSQAKEPSPKRRKTIHKVSDLEGENSSYTPSNKRLLTVGKPASIISPKVNSFNVLQQSKRKSFIPIANTPKCVKKIISTKVRRSRSSLKQLSPRSKSSIDKSTEFISKKVTPEKLRKTSTPKNVEITRKSKTPAHIAISPLMNLGKDTTDSPKRNSPQKSPVNISKPSSSSKNKAPTPAKNMKSSPKLSKARISLPSKLTPKLPKTPKNLSFSATRVGSYSGKSPNPPKSSPGQLTMKTPIIKQSLTRESDAPLVKSPRVKSPEKKIFIFSSPQKILATSEKSILSSPTTPNKSTMTPSEDKKSSPSKIQKSLLAQVSPVDRTPTSVLAKLKETVANSPIRTSKRFSKATLVSPKVSNTPSNTPNGRTPKIKSSKKQSYLKETPDNSSKKKSRRSSNMLTLKTDEKSNLPQTNLKDSRGKKSNTSTPKTDQPKEELKSQSPKAETSSLSPLNKSQTPGKLPLSEIYQNKPASKQKRTPKGSVLKSLSPEVNNVVSPHRRVSTRKSITSSSKPIVLKSSGKKGSISNLQSCKRARNNDAEAKAERAAKRLKMETPKSLSKNKVAALLVCHGRSPKGLQKRMLYSDILKTRLSATKQKPFPSNLNSIVVKKKTKQKTFEPKLEVPKSFKFNSTGHANSPETIVITKKLHSTPAPKTRKGRKSATEILLPKGSIKEEDLQGVPDLFKTPSRAIVSSLKTASSAKKPSNVRVRFSLQNEVKSSGRNSSVMHSDQTSLNKSPMMTKKRIGTPRPPRISESSLCHTSIIEESPVSQNSILLQESNLPVSKRKSRLSVQSTNSYDFSAYSPSSPTLQFSQISGVSSHEPSKSNDFSNISEVSDYLADSPKRKSSYRLSAITSKGISIASSQISKAKQSLNKCQDANDSLPRNDQSFSSLGDNASINSRRNSTKSNDISINTSGVFRFSPESNHSSLEKSPKTKICNVSQIPLPPSSPISTRSNTSKCSIRSTRSNSNVSETPKAANNFSKTGINKSSLTNKSVTKNLSLNNLSNFEAASRISSTPKHQSVTNISSPFSSPIVISERRSLGKKSVTSASLSNHYTFGNENKSNSDSLPIEQASLLTPGRKQRKASGQTSVDSSTLTSESQVPVATVKPSTRKNQGNESISPESISLSMPSDSHDISGRSIDRHLSKKMIDSRASSSIGLLSESLRSTPSSSFEYAHTSSSRRKRKSSSLSNVHSMNNTAFDFSSAATPNVPMEMFISPLDQSYQSANDLACSGTLNNVMENKRQSKTLIPANSLKEVENSSPANYSYVGGVKRLLRTPKLNKKEVKTPIVDGVKELFKNTPVNDYTDVRGVKRLLKTPKPASPLEDYANIDGIKSLFKHSHVADYTNVSGVKTVLNSKGLSPVSSYDDLRGLKKLLKSPKPGTSDFTNVEGLKDLFRQSPIADYTNVSGVKQLYSTSTEPNYMNVKGVRRIFIEAKTPNSPDVAGVEVLYESPKKKIDEYSQSSTSRPIVKVSPMYRGGSLVQLEANITNEQANNPRQRKTRQTNLNLLVTEEETKTEVRKTRGRKRINTNLTEETQNTTCSLRKQPNCLQSPNKSPIKIIFKEKTTREEIVKKKRIKSDVATHNSVEQQNVMESSTNLLVNGKSPERSVQVIGVEISESKEIITRGKRNTHKSPKLSNKEKLKLSASNKEKLKLSARTVKSPVSSPLKSTLPSDYTNENIKATGSNENDNLRETRSRRGKVMDDNLKESSNNIRKVSGTHKLSKRKSHSHPESVSPPKKVCSTKMQNNKSIDDFSKTDLSLEKKQIPLNVVEDEVCPKQTRTRSRRVEADKILEKQQSSPIKPKGRGKQAKSKEPAIKTSPKQTKGKSKEVFENAEGTTNVIRKPLTSPLKSNKVSPKTRNGRSKRGAISVLPDDNQSLINSLPLELRGRCSKANDEKVLVNLESAKLIKGVQSSRKKGRATITEQETSPSKVIDISPVKSKNRKTRRNANDETSTPIIDSKGTVTSKSSVIKKTDVASSAEVKTTKSPKGKKSISGGNTLEPEESLVDKIENKVNEKEQKSETLPKRTRRATKTKDLPKAGNISSTRKEIEEETNHTTRLDERLNEESIDTQKLPDKRAKRVQFNKCEMVYSITPTMGRQLRSNTTCAISKMSNKSTPPKKVVSKSTPPKKVVSTKVARTKKSDIKRKSTSPVKSPPKRITRARK